MKRKVKNMKRKAGTIFLTAVTTILIASTIIPTIAATPYHNGDAPDHLQIISITMSDYNLRCRAMGGDYVSIAVVVKNTGDTTITEDFSVYLFISQSKYLNQEGVTEDFSPGETYTVHFDNEFIYESVGSYTMDAYINDDYDTRYYCNFIVTATGAN